MAPVLDIVALRSLVGVADRGGFHRAAEALCLSQPAVSQHIRRLEKAIGRPVVERHGRGTSFTADGQLLLTEARRILAAHDDAVRRLSGVTTTSLTVGTTEHAAGLILPIVTATLTDFDVRFRIDRTARLDEAVDRGTLDLAVTMAEVSAAAAEPIGALALNWYAAPAWTPPAPVTPWPVVAIEDPCLLRKRALEALTTRGLQPYVVCDTGYLGGVTNAARAGLGVALLADTGDKPEGLTARPDLPPVAPAALGLRARHGTDPALTATVTSALRAALAA